MEEYPKYCFKNCPKLVRTGGTAAAFAGYTQMYTLQILAVTPPTIGSRTREELAEDLIIRVPDSEADGDSIYMAYLEVLKAAVGKKCL